MNNIQTGAIIISKGSLKPWHWDTWLTRIFTWSMYTHAGLVVNGRDWSVLETTRESGAYIDPENIFEEDIIIHMPLTDEQKNEINWNSQDLVGLPYSYRDAAYYGLSRLGFKFAKKRALDEYRSAFCSQLIDIALRKSGITLFDTREPHEVVPKHFICLAEEMGWEIEYGAKSVDTEGISCSAA